MKLFCCAIIFIGALGIAGAISSAPPSGDSIPGVSEYSNLAKEFNKKAISPEDAQKLFAAARPILESIKQKYITKMGAPNFILRYPNGKDFPDISEHNLQDKYNEQIIKFTIAIHLVYKNLTDEVLLKIIEKSPLELIPLLQEIDVFLRFVSANPAEFGHGVFTEKKGDQLIVLATDDAILRIMRVIVISNLLSSRAVYKLSRVTSAIYRDFPSKKPEDIIAEVIENLKRNLSDDTRVPIFTQYEVLGS
jgi:hypothetical protein